MRFTGVDVGIVEIGVSYVAKHLGCGVDVAFRSPYVCDADGRSGSIPRQNLHDPYRSARASGILLQHRLLVALGGEHQVIEIIFFAVPLEDGQQRLEFCDFLFRGRILYPPGIFQVAPN